MGSVTRANWKRSEPRVVKGEVVGLNVEHAIVYRGSSGQYNLAFPLGEGDAETLAAELETITGG